MYDILLLIFVAHAYNSFRIGRIGQEVGCLLD